jgi:hypothetical protein
MRRIAALAALAVVGAGCGGGGSGPDPIVRAAEKTADAGSLKADLQIAGPSLEGVGKGVFDNDQRGTGKLTLAVRSQGQSVIVDTIALGSLLFIRSDVFRQAGLPAGKEWVRLDLAKLAKQQGVDLGSLTSSNPSPSGGLAYLRGSNGEVEKVGGEKVQGVETTHYKTTVDLERAADRASGRARDSIKRVIRVSGAKRIPVEAWIDGEGYIRKMIYTEHAGRRQSSKVTMELHDFGPHVAIASPPSERVIDLQEFLKQQQGG